jgi:hypothetical protein
MNSSEKWSTTHVVVFVCTVYVSLPSGVELVSEDDGRHDGDGDGLHGLEDGGEERASPVDAPYLQSKRHPGRHQPLEKQSAMHF